MHSFLSLPALGPPKSRRRAAMLECSSQRVKASWRGGPKTSLMVNERDSPHLGWTEASGGSAYGLEHLVYALRN